MTQYIIWTTPDNREIKSTPEQFAAAVAHHTRNIRLGIKRYDLETAAS